MIGVGKSLSLGLLIVGAVFNRDLRGLAITL
jgi:hypothetical protein